MKPKEKFVRIKVGASLKKHRMILECLGQSGNF